MAFIVSGKSFDTSKPALGALTGLAGGLAHGLRISREQQLEAGRLALAGQEMALRQKAFEHGIQKEEDVAKWARGIGEYKAWEAAGGDPIQGPPEPITNQPPGGIGPTTQSPGAPLGNAPLDPQVRAQKIASLASRMTNLDQAKALESTLIQDHQEQIIGEHRDALLAEIRDARIKGAFRSKVLGGGEDLSGETVAQELEKATAEVDPSNPKEAAARLDSLRATKTAYLQHAAASDTALMLHDRANQTYLQDIDAQAAAHQPIDEATSRYNLWTKGIIPDEEMQKTWQDALHGTHTLKAQMQQMQQELTSARTQAEIAKMFLSTPDGLRLLSQLRTNEGVAKEGAAQTNRETNIHIKGEEDRKTAEVRKNNLSLPGNLLNRSRASQIAKDTLGFEATPATMEAKIKELMGEAPAAQADTPEAILNDTKATKEERIKRAQALGFKSYAELEAAAKKK